MDYFQIQFTIQKIHGFEIVKKTFDLDNEENFWENIQTEHEKMFMEQGIKIKGLIAKNSTHGDGEFGAKDQHVVWYFRRNVYE